MPRSQRTLSFFFRWCHSGSRSYMGLGTLNGREISDSTQAGVDRMPWLVGVVTFLLKA